MSLRLGEHFILGFRGPRLPDWMIRFEKRFGLGGVILFDYDYQRKVYENNIESPNQIKQLCTQIHALASRPLVFIDQEGGKVRRLKEKLGFAPLPGHEEWATLPQGKRQALLYASLREMRTLGIDFDLAPVIDVNYLATNPDIGAIGRSFSAKPEEVRMLTMEWAEAARIAGVQLCLKHYPGLGGAKTNSHKELTDLSDVIHSDQLALFFELTTKIPGQALLVSHGWVKQWDTEFPASLSPSALTELRHRVPDSLILSDDLQMEGLRAQFSTDESATFALRAGIDQVIIGNNLHDEQNDLEEIVSSLEEKLGKEKAPFLTRLSGARARVLERKSHLLA